MDKYSYIKLCIQNKLYIKKDWLISILSLIKSSDKRLSKPYLYMLNQTSNGYEYYTEEGFVLLDNVELGKPLFFIRDPIKVDPSFSKIIKEDMDSTIGRLLVNVILLEHPFRGNLSYINKAISVGMIESMIEPLLKDTPDKEVDPNDPSIYVSDYLEFVKALGFMAGLSQVSVQGSTEKTLVGPTGIKEFKAGLIKKYGNRLNDPIVFQEFENELIKFDTDYLKGDIGGDLYMSGNKNRRVVRKQLFLAMGAEAGMDDTKLPNPILNSLEEGWEIDKFPDVLNTQRSGSFARGAGTALGGELTKWLMRASSNTRVAGKDCGTKLGMRSLVKDSDKHRYINRYVITDKGPILITQENFNNFVGKRVAIRSPMYCTNPDLTYCEVCLGKNLSSNSLGLSMAVSEVGSNFMGVTMNAMHSVAVDIIDINEEHLFT